MPRTMFLEVPESELKDLELGEVVAVKVRGKVKGMRAKPEKPKGKKGEDCCGPMDDDYYKYASLDITVQEISIIEDSNEFSKLDEAMDEETR